MSRINLELVHDGKHHDLTLESIDELTQEDLSKQVETVTGVPIINQRLIFKGKSLTDPGAKLTICGLKNGCKLMLIGKKLNPEDEGHMKVMQSVENGVISTNDKLAEIAVEVTDIQRGFLAVDLRDEALSKLGHQVLVCCETFTSSLERLDALSLATATTDIQNRRKNIVRKIQDSLTKADDLQNRITEALAKTKL